MASSTPSNNNSTVTPPTGMVTRSRFNKGGVQPKLLPPLPEGQQTPPTEKGSRARKRPLSRQHTTITGIEMKMETLASDVLVTQEPFKTENKETSSGEPKKKKEPTASTFTAALCEELLRYPLLKLEKCSPEETTRTHEEPPAKEKINFVPDHEPITPKLESQPDPVQVDVASDHNKEEPITPKLEAKSAESSSLRNTPKLESMSTEPSTPNIPKLESMSTEPKTPEIFEEDWNYQVTLDSVLHSNAPGLWHADEMETLLSQYSLDKCIFNDETPALFELL